MTIKFLKSKKEVFAEYKKTGIKIDFAEFAQKEINLLLKILKYTEYTKFVNNDISESDKRYNIEILGKQFVYLVFDVLDGLTKIEDFLPEVEYIKKILTKNLSIKEAEVILRQISFDITIFLKSIKKLNYNYKTPFSYEG